MGLFAPLALRNWENFLDAFLFLADSEEKQVYLGGDFVNLSLDSLLIVLQPLHPLDNIIVLALVDTLLSLLHHDRLCRVDDLPAHGLDGKAGAEIVVFIWLEPQNFIWEPSVE